MSNVIAERILGELKRRNREIDKETEMATGEVNNAIVSAAKSLASERLTKRGAKIYSQFYKATGDNTQVGISNDFPMEGKWDIADIIENKGAKEHPITVRDPENNTLKYFWFPAHIKKTKSKMFGTAKWHTDRIETQHPGLPKLHIMRDAQKSVLEDFSGQYYARVAKKVGEIAQKAMIDAGW